MVAQAPLSSRGTPMEPGGQEGSPASASPQGHAGAPRGRPPRAQGAPAGRCCPPVAPGEMDSPGLVKQNAVGARQGHRALSQSYFCCFNSFCKLLLCPMSPSHPLSTLPLEQSLSWSTSPAPGPAPASGCLVLGISHPKPLTRSCRCLQMLSVSWIQEAGRARDRTWPGHYSGTAPNTCTYCQGMALFSLN